MKTPVTILTGYLGSGKTTLLNRILTEQHGLRIAVIENEYGEVGVDHELVLNAEEEIFEMNNGCICCTVRGDLIRIMGSLMNRRDKFDHIIIETTGLADPGPVVQTFFVDEDMKDQFVINAVVTLVDARHIWLSLGKGGEASEQIAFADLILLNKSDLVAPADLDRLEARVKSMNHVAKIYRSVRAGIDIARIFEVGGFNLEHAIGVDPRFLEPEYPFEWGGVFELSAGTATFTATECPDPTMRLVLIPIGAGDADALTSARDQAVRLFSSLKVRVLRSGAVVVAGPELQELVLQEGPMSWPIEVPADGHYALFTQHYPEELDLRLYSAGKEANASSAAAFKPDHEHDDQVGSVGIEEMRECDGPKLDAWLSMLLRERGQDIFRMKGVFAVHGNPDRIIFQGVHMLLDAQSGGPWGARKRKNSLVFIGRDLNREELVAGFRSCLKP